jgi:hypothetical protein
VRELNPQEKLTVRIAGVVLIIFFVGLGGSSAWKFLQGRRLEYNQLVLEAQNLRAELRPYETKAQTTTTLMEKFQMDPAKLNKATVVADASAAIQKAAMTGGIQLGPIRESPARTAAKELTSIQMDGTGQVQAIMTFLSRFESLGFPLILDSVQITSDPQKPQMIKVHLNIVIMDFEQWKSEERPNA